MKHIANRSKILISLVVLIVLFYSCSQGGQVDNKPITQIMKDSLPLRNPYYSRTDTAVLHVSDEEWKKVLPEEVYFISRKKDTERAFTGKYWNFEGLGTYYCAACGNPLFRSDAKFASSCGWPSFYKALNSNSVVYEDDNSYGMKRTEVMCGRCRGHLGHIFDDGPPPTHRRFCMNSIVLEFEPDQK